MAGFEASEAALVFFDPSVELVPTPNRPVFDRIDMDGDGSLDIGITVGTASSPDAAGNNGIVNVGGLGGAQLAFSGAYPTAFGASDMIDSALNFQTAIGTLAFSSAGNLGDRGFWVGGGEGYFGVRFHTGDQCFFGWLHAVWDPELNTLTINQAAYEDSGAAAMIMDPPPPPPPEFDLTVDEVAGEVSVTWDAIAGAGYEVQHSVDGENWNTIHSVTAVENGELSYVDANPNFPEDLALYRIEQMGSSLLLLAFGLRRGKRRSG